MPIDMRSDTVTRPSAAMRRAMAEAEVGDDVLDGDPTVRALESAVATLLGKERALFFPSGTMANQTAVWLLSTPGTEILLDAGAHIIHYEMAGAAALAGAQVRPVAPSGLVMNADDLRGAMRSPSAHGPAASLVCLENTHNGAGGKITPLEEMRALAEVARERSLPVHLDGARLWNASLASGTAMADFAACADTVMVSFSKGLGAPVGAALAGSAAVMERGWTVRKRFGGGMRQSGILAAGARYGIDHNWSGMKTDHENARLFAQIVGGVRGASVVPPDTNIVMVDLPGGVTSAPLIAKAAERGVLLNPWSPSRIRAVTHLDVSTDQVRTAAETLAELIRAA